MERLLQYLDDLDDLIGALGLLAERFRILALKTALTLAPAVAGITGILLALSEPTLGLAVIILLCVVLLYRSVTAPVRVTQSGYEKP